MSDDLDVRARAAADAIHRVVADVPIPSVPPRRRPARPVLAVAAVLLLVTGAVAWFAGRGSRPTNVAADRTGGVPRLVLGDVPEGLEPTGAVDLPLPEAAGIVSRWWVYGDPTAWAAPFTQADLGVGVLANVGDDASEADGVEVDVGGLPGWRRIEGDPVLRRSIVVPLGDDLLVATSSTLDDDALLDAVRGLGLGDGIFDAPDELTDGLALVATSEAGLGTGSIPIPLPTERGSMVGYQSDDDQRLLAVASVAGDENDLLVARWALGPSAREVELRGTRGWIGEPFGEGSQVVIWRETETGIVAMLGSGFRGADVLTAAETLREADDDEWDGLRALRTEANVPEGAVSVSGDLPGGGSYAASRRTDGSLCLDVVDDGGSNGTCQQSAGTSGALEAAAQETEGGAVVVYGYTTAGAGGEVVITADGDPIGPSEAYDSTGTVFVFVDEAPPYPSEVVVRDRAGSELARVPLSLPTPAD